MRITTRQDRCVQPLELVHRGYQVVYHPGETNRCPGCGHSNWLIGRFTAQCGFCSTALALASQATNHVDLAA